MARRSRRFPHQARPRRRRTGRARGRTDRRAARTARYPRLPSTGGSGWESRLHRSWEVTLPWLARGCPSGAACGARLTPVADTKKGGFTAEEKAAMKERARELKRQETAAEAEQDVLAKIAEMAAPDRALA